MRVLALETSCDETSAAVVHRVGGTVTLEGMAILSQDIHRIFGGVVPELASRAHLATVGDVVDHALARAGAALADLDGIAVTRGPGLLGALLVGVTWGKTLAWREGLPLIGVHHLEGHLFAPVLEDPTVEPPFTALLVSGGHTMLLDVPQWGEYRLLGQTKDDAAGEAFDKVGALLGLDYPAGAAIERLARDGDPARFRFPRPLLHRPAEVDRWHFSFSGLKTAVLRAVQQSDDLVRDRADLARGFQDAAIDVLTAKTADAARAHGRPLVVLGGGGRVHRRSRHRDAHRPRRHRPGRGRLTETQHRQRCHDRRRGELAVAGRGATRPRPRGPRQPAPSRPRPPHWSAAMITAYPLEFGPVTGFGITMMLLFVMGAWIMDRECRRLGYNTDFPSDLILGAVVGGILGAKLWFVALHGIDTLFSRSGLVYYGGFVGGTLGVILMGWRRRVPVRLTAHLAAPALAAGYAIGRVGCFVVGDDYGVPTTRPWGVGFPEGAPPSTAAIMERAFGVPIAEGVDPAMVLAVHPTQLYEVAAMLLVFALLWRWRTTTRGTGWLFGVYLVFAGIERFLVEILRAKDDRLLGVLTVAQSFSVVLVVVGLVLMTTWGGQGAAAPGAWLAGTGSRAPARG